MECQKRIIEGSVIREPTIDKLKSSNAQMVKFIHIVHKGMIQS